MMTTDTFKLSTSSAILVTGAAGFIGFHLALHLLREGYEVLGFDNINDYYDPAIKHARLDILRQHKKFQFEKGDLADGGHVMQIFSDFKFDYVAHLAAQAGVRHSLKKPMDYMQSNMMGFFNILESCRHHAVKHLVYASSSSVYGSNRHQPFSVKQHTDHPLSLYAASKKSNEMMAHSYAHLYRIPVTGLRFFTVYGPWGRPDMAVFIFTKAILNREPIPIFNHGKMQRDFTYIDDIIQGVSRTLAVVAQADATFDASNPDPSISQAPYRLLNIGNHQSVALMRMIELLERELGIEAIKDYHPMQPGDVVSTEADVERLTQLTGFAPNTPIEEGLAKFVRWYRDYSQS